MENSVVLSEKSQHFFAWKWIGMPMMHRMFDFLTIKLDKVEKLCRIPIHQTLTMRFKMTRLSLMKHARLQSPTHAKIWLYFAALIALCQPNLSIYAQPPNDNQQEEQKQEESKLIEQNPLIFDNSTLTNNNSDVKIDEETCEKLCAIFEGDGEQKNPLNENLFVNSNSINEFSEKSIKGEEVIKSQPSNKKRSLENDDSKDDPNAKNQQLVSTKSPKKDKLFRDIRTTFECLNETIKDSKLPKPDRSTLRLTRKDITNPKTMEQWMSVLLERLFWCLRDQNDKTTSIYKPGPGTTTEEVRQYFDTPVALCAGAGENPFVLYDIPHSYTKNINIDESDGFKDEWLEIIGNRCYPERIHISLDCKDPHRLSKEATKKLIRPDNKITSIRLCNYWLDFKCIAERCKKLKVFNGGLLRKYENDQICKIVEHNKELEDLTLGYLYSYEFLDKIPEESRIRYLNLSHTLSLDARIEALDNNGISENDFSDPDNFFYIDPQFILDNPHYLSESLDSERFGSFTKHILNNIHKLKHLKAVKFRDSPVLTSEALVAIAKKYPDVKISYSAEYGEGDLEKNINEFIALRSNQSKDLDLKGLYYDFLDDLIKEIKKAYPKIEGLRLGCSVGYPDDAPLLHCAIKELSEGCPNIKRLSLKIPLRGTDGSNNADSSDPSEVLNVASNFKELEYLSLTTVYMGYMDGDPADSKLFALTTPSVSVKKLLQSCKTLKTLRIKNYHFDSSFFPALISNKNLEHIDLRRCLFTLLLEKQDLLKVLSNLFKKQASNLMRLDGGLSIAGSKNVCPFLPSHGEKFEGTGPSRGYSILYAAYKPEKDVTMLTTAYMTSAYNFERRGAKAQIFTRSVKLHPDAISCEAFSIKVPFEILPDLDQDSIVGFLKAKLPKLKTLCFSTEKTTQARLKKKFKEEFPFLNFNKIPDQF